MKLGEMVNVYGVLGEASSLKMEDTLKVLRIRKALRPHVDEWNAFYKDIQEKVATSWESMNEEERMEVNRLIESELNKDIEVTFEKLSEEGVASIISSVGCKVREGELLAIMEK